MPGISSVYLQTGVGSGVDADEVVKPMGLVSVALTTVSGLPTYMGEQFTRPDVAGCELGSGSTVSADDEDNLLACFAAILNTPEESGSCSYAYVGEHKKFKVSMNNVRGLKTYDGVEQASRCVRVKLSPTATSKLCLDATIATFYIWVCRDLSDRVARISLVEASNSDHTLPVVSHAVRDLCSCVCGMHVLAKTAKYDSVSYTVIPWEAVTLHTQATTTLGLVHASETATQLPQLDGGVGRHSLGFTAAQSSHVRNMHANAVSASCDVTYTHRWYKSDIQRGISAVKLQASQATNIPSVNCAVAEASRDTATAVVVVRCRNSAELLYSHRTISSCPYTQLDHKVYNGGTGCYDALLADSFTVDSRGCIVTKTSWGEDIRVETSVTTVLSEAMQGRTATAVCIKHLGHGVPLLLNLFRRSGLDATLNLNASGYTIIWSCDQWKISGTMLITANLGPCSPLQGIISSKPVINGRGRPLPGELLALSDHDNSYGPLMYCDNGMSLLGRFLLRKYIKDYVYLETRHLVLPSITVTNDLYTGQEKHYVGFNSRQEVTIAVVPERIDGADYINAVYIEDGSIISAGRISNNGENCGPRVTSLKVNSRAALRTHSSTHADEVAQRATGDLASENRATQQDIRGDGSTYPPHNDVIAPPGDTCNSTTTGLNVHQYIAKGIVQFKTNAGREAVLRAVTATQAKHKRVTWFGVEPKKNLVRALSLVHNHATARDEHKSRPTDQVNCDALQALLEHLRDKGKIVEYCSTRAPTNADLTDFMYSGDMTLEVERTAYGYMVK